MRYSPLEHSTENTLLVHEWDGWLAVVRVFVHHAEEGLITNMTWMWEARSLLWYWWYTDGILMEYWWNTDGYWWNTDRILMKYWRNTDRILMEHRWNFDGINHPQLPDVIKYTWNGWKKLISWFLREKITWSKSVPQLDVCTVFIYISLESQLWSKMFKYFKNASWKHLKPQPLCRKLSLLPP